MVPVLMLALLLVAGAARAQQPALACDPQERADVCELKVQRNSALDEIAIEKRKQELMTNAEKALEKYWKDYVDGDVAKADWWNRLWAWLSIKPVARR